MKKKIVTFAVLLFFIFITVCHAGTNDSRIRIEYMDNTITNVNIYGTQFSNRQGYVFVNEMVGYCVEPGIYIRSDIYDSNDNFDMNHITNSQKEKMELYAYYGYQYSGHQTRNYYLATQQLIWEELGITDILFTTGMNRSGQVLPVMNERNEILRLIQEHSKKPSFDNQKVKVSSGESLILKDENQVLDTYNIVKPKEQVEKMDNHQLKIDSQKIGKQTVELEKKLNYQASMIYRKENSQTLATFGLSNKIRSSFSIETEGYYIEIEKKDALTEGEAGEGRSLKGAVYEIQDTDRVVIDTVTTDEKGYARSKALPASVYWIKEKSASPGYLVDEKTYVVSVNKNKKVYHAVLMEQPIEKEITIQKYREDVESEEEVVEPNISFQIFDNVGNEIRTIKTDEFGIARISLPFGVYRFHQLNSTEHYQLIDDFTITIDEQSQNKIEKKLVDKPETGEIVIEKIGESTKDFGKMIPLSDITFELYTEKQGQKVLKDEKKTNEEGMIQWTQLPFGNYCVKEKETKEGYQLDTHFHCFTLLGQEVKKLKLKNELIKTKFEFEKIGERFLKIENHKGIYEEIPLENVFFEIYQKTNKNDILVGVVSSDKHGKVSFEKYLPSGEYYLKEIKTGENHILTEEKLFFQVKPNTHEANLDFTSPVKNKMIKGSISIKKVDENNLPLNDTVFAIYNMDNQLLFEEKTTGTGQIEIEDFPFGKYEIKETKAKEGYLKKEEPIHFEISKNKQSVALKITNQKEQYPNTSDYITKAKQLIVGVTIFGILILLIGVFVEKRK